MALPFQEFINDFIASNVPVKPEAEFSESISELVQPMPESYDSIAETTTDLIRRIIGNADVKSMKRSVRISLIKFMEEKGVFKIKGSVDTVAELMQISKVTVYSYLDVVRKENNGTIEK
jgi:predicted transcriptional regulator YheO